MLPRLCLPCSILRELVDGLLEVSRPDKESPELLFLDRIGLVLHEQVVGIRRWRLHSGRPGC